jgi:hypothetical protein
LHEGKPQGWRPPSFRFLPHRLSGGCFLERLAGVEFCHHSLSAWLIPWVAIFSLIWVGWSSSFQCRRSNGRLHFLSHIYIQHISCNQAHLAMAMLFSFFPSRFCLLHMIPVIYLACSTCNSCHNSERTESPSHFSPHHYYYLHRSHSANSSAGLGDATKQSDFPALVTVELHYGAPMLPSHAIGQLFFRTTPQEASAILSSTPGHECTPLFRRIGATMFRKAPFFCRGKAALLRLA